MLDAQDLKIVLMGVTGLRGWRTATGYWDGGVRQSIGQTSELLGKLKRRSLLIQGAITPPFVLGVRVSVGYFYGRKPYGRPHSYGREYHKSFDLTDPSCMIQCKYWLFQTVLEVEPKAKMVDELRRAISSAPEKLEVR